MSWRMRLATYLAQMISGQPVQFGTVTAQVDDSPGWMRYGGSAYDRDLADQQRLYADAIAAWRHNPLARRAVDITTDFVVGDEINIRSPHPALDDFIQCFVHHRKNRHTWHLETICSELTLAGDVFPVLFTNEQDGMSYVRFVPKDQIVQIETAEQDWATETQYLQVTGAAGETRTWPGPGLDSDPSQPLMLHFAVNRPIGALFGESDLAAVLPWLRRYSRLLEERLRLHWAARLFLWVVNVPPHLVAAKQEQYAAPPEAGSVIIKDESEQWQSVNPDVRARDAGADLEAIRRYIYAGTSHPPHWFGEPGSNLAEARAMQNPAERHLRRRQKHFLWMLQEILWTAYQRAVALDKAPSLESNDFSQLFLVQKPDISRQDNQELAGAARDLTAALQQMGSQLPGQSRTFSRRALELLFKFAGEPLPVEVLDEIVTEAFGNRDG